jgi:hypothetical protein
MPVMCDTCFSISPTKYRYGINCKNDDCYGEMVEIDENFIQAISLLNKKGYYTVFCCSGHPFKNKSIASYILFKQTVNLPYIPSKCNLDGDHCIRYYFKAKNDVDQQLEILELAIDVLKWAIELPDLNGEGK